MEDPRAAVHSVLASINRAWREYRPSAMQEFLHPDVTMALPGFQGVVVGREAFLAGFEEFCTGARVLRYRETEEQIHIVDDCAVASYRFDMVYEVKARRTGSTGRDLWVFRRSGEKWLAVWRTMLELTDTPNGVQ